MKSSKILIFLLFICFVCISCRTEDKQTTFDYSGFKVDKTTNQLCFDLSSDTKVLGAIALKASKNSKNSNTVILPFETQNISYNKKILNTSSSNDNFTIIDYLTSIDKEWLFFLPKYGETESKERGIFLLKEGLKREFIINFDETHPNKELLAQTDTISQITVQLPAKSKTFRTKIEPIFENEDFYEYAIVQILSKPDKTFRLEYMVQATKKQKELIDFLLKLAAIFFIPFAQFFFLEKEPTDPKKIKVKKYTIWGTIILQGIIFSFLIYFSYTEYKDTGNFPIYEIILLIIGSVVEFLVLWMKHDSKKHLTTVDS